VFFDFNISLNDDSEASNSMSNYEEENIEFDDSKDICKWQFV